MRGPWEATVTAVAALLLGLVVFPAIYLSAGILALVGLQLGLASAARVAAFALVAAGIASALLAGDPRLGVVAGAAAWVPVAVLGAVAGNAGSIRPAFFGAMVLGALVVGGFHLWLPDPAVWWKGALESALNSPEIARALSADRGIVVEEVAPRLAMVMTGVVAAMSALGLSISLALGRWWQSALYRPGAFGAEFRRLDFGRHLAGALGVMIAAAFFGSALALHLALVLGAGFLLQGLAIGHAIAHRRKWHVAWVAGFYLVLFLFPQVALALAALGALDPWVGFRGLSRPR